VRQSTDEEEEEVQERRRRLKLSEKVYKQQQAQQKGRKSTLTPGGGGGAGGEGSGVQDMSETGESGAFGSVFGGERWDWVGGGGSDDEVVGGLIMRRSWLSPKSMGVSGAEGGGERGGMGWSMRGDSDDSGLGLEERGGGLRWSLSPLGEGAPIRVLRQMDEKSPLMKLGAVGRVGRGRGGGGGDEKLRETLLAETVVALKTKLRSLKADIEREREVASVREREQLQELARFRAREREAELLSEEQEREREKERTRDLVSTRVLRDQVSGLEEQLRCCQVSFADI
jgi:hypothetical protein